MTTRLSTAEQGMEGFYVQNVSLLMAFNIHELAIITAMYVQRLFTMLLE